MGRHFEEFEVDSSFRTIGRTVFESDVIQYIGLAGIHDEIYTNLEYAREASIFGRQFVPGPLTFSLAEGLVIQSGHFYGTAMVLLGVEMTFQSPMFVGDTFYVTVTVVDKHETKKPDRGVVTFLHYVDKTTGERVMTLTKKRMIRRLLVDDSIDGLARDG